MGIVPTPESDRARFWAKVDQNGPAPSHRPEIGGCWLWTAARFSNGYGAFRVGAKQRRAHVVSYEWHIGPVPDGLLVLHRCDVKHCLKPDHLFVGSQRDNIQDALTKGRMATGERSGMHTRPDRRPTGSRNGQRLHPERTARGERVSLAKLTAEKVREVRHLSEQGVDGATIAYLFGMGTSAIYAVIHRKTWRHVV